MMDPNLLDSVFHKLHEAGAERHLTRWFELNHVAADAISALGGDRSDKFTRCLATLVLLRTLDRIQPLGLRDDPNEKDLDRLLSLIRV